MRPRLLLRVGAFTAVMALLVWVAPPSNAEPDDDPGSALATTLSLAAVGSETSLWFFGDATSASLSFPVPPGLIPDTLNATVDLPFPMRSGILSVMQDDRLISRIGLPLADLAPVVIPLGGLDVVDDSASVTLRLTSLAEDGYCLDQLNPVGLIDSSITYAGTEVPPTNVADFLPPILRVLTIGVPSTPSQAESDAAVQLAAAVQARYRTQEPRVILAPLADGATTIDVAPQPMERQIVIKEGPDAGLSLTGPAPQLLISGPPDKLTNQTRLLTDPSLNMAVSTKVTASELHPSPPLPGDSTTLAQLGQPSLSNASVSPQVGIALDQTRFGHPSQGFRLHLMGSYTPVPSDLGAQLTASVDGEIFDSWSVERAGAIDHWVEVPDRLLSRYTNLVIGIETSGHTGRCNEFRPITLTINGDTVVESTPAQPPIPAGFLSLPQALMPRMQVGLGTQNFADTARATQIIVGLQHLSVMPLQTQVTSLKQAIDSTDPAILVSPDSWEDSSVVLPVSDRDRQLTLKGFGDSDQETTLTLDPGIRFGSLQTVIDGQRSLLVATSNGAPEQLDELLRWLDDDPKGWSKLRGSVVVAVEGQAPQLVPGRTPQSVYGPPVSPENDQKSGQTAAAVPAWWTAVGVTTAIVIAVGAFWLGGRRSRRSHGNSHRAHKRDETT
ncbi:hypothetical protein ORI20_20710 [Mycobacterium sp. CVI_P3]|uniref:Cellulose biosynthesis cyclic di-GMP-binding regulatory protein BcsB n=1 Tax=Mycobacterium pinniadriaticum TaxID=2994102 RepID=A0ABT3SHW9_9MYCO|nr:hypothetical protein [Mycobacterium pinniadriaticum]MCX2932698.1 hypothetical protein [Mycobacterium pinniadriaticum]MCX2939122.1 hypothetical protein [Mycobacterium pinniadriaticum]